MSISGEQSRAYPDKNEDILSGKQKFSEPHGRIKKTHDLRSRSYGEKLEKPRYHRAAKKREALERILEGLADINVVNNGEDEAVLRRKDFESDIVSFLKQNFGDYFDVLYDSVTKSDDIELTDALIEKLGLTSNDLLLLGPMYSIRKHDGHNKIFISDDAFPQGIPVSRHDEKAISLFDLMALSYAKNQLTLDTFNPIHRRYIYKPTGNYLSDSDFGMKVWDDELNQMVPGRADDVAPFIKAVATHFKNISSNIVDVSNVSQPGEDEVGSVENTRARTKELLMNNPKDLDIVMRAIPYRKFNDHLHFRYEKMARKLGLFTDDPRADYKEYIKTDGQVLDTLVTNPSETEKAGSTFQYINDQYFEKPVIIPNYFDSMRFIQRAKDGVRDALAERAAAAESEEFNNLFYNNKCTRGEESPFFFSNALLYDFISHIGLDRSKEIFSSEKIFFVNHIMNGYEHLKAIQFNFDAAEASVLRKQLFEANKLADAQLFDFFKNKDADESDMPLRTVDWLQSLESWRSRKIFRQAKRMYYLAQKVFAANPNNEEDAKFYHRTHMDLWSNYDISAGDISEEKMNKHLTEDFDLIAFLLSSSDTRTYAWAEVENTPITLHLIMSALGTDHNIESVVLAKDQESYLKKLIDTDASEVTDVVAFALADWPAEWRAAVSSSEISMFYENRREYIANNQVVLTKYAAWRASEGGQLFNKIFEKDPKNKSELDLRLALSVQPFEVQEWYREGADYVGNDIISSFITKFTQLKNSQGGFASLHDNLYWLGRIKNLSAEEAKTIIASIHTVDERDEFANLLGRYSKMFDISVGKGGILSLKELRSRIYQIENNIDLSKLPPEVYIILGAPAFSKIALTKMTTDPRFEQLMQGEFDKKQPFKPHARVFTELPLCDLLKEALGVRSEGIAGKANDPKKLFGKIKKLVDERNDQNGQVKMNVADLFKSVPYDLEEELIELLQGHSSADFNVGPLYEAQIHPKSDPEGWVCGNYTDCCMDFGEDNNNDYMFNEGTQYFTIKYNGRIVAQSVVVDAIDTDTQKSIILLDNIEVADAYKRHAPMLSAVYNVFWTEYTSTPVKMGAGYSDIIPAGARLERNTYKPVKPLLYSDARHPNVYGLSKVNGIEPISEAVTVSNVTIKDASRIAKMEQRSYPEEMVSGKAHIEEILTKQRELEVPGAASSFILRMGKKEAGYVLVLPEDSEINPGETVAHIYDMAILPEFRGKSLARQMMTRVLEVATTYGVSIEAEAREGTSYAMLTDPRIQEWIRSQGFELTHTKKLDKYLGDEDFYFVRLQNIQKSDDADRE